MRSSKRVLVQAVRGSQNAAETAASLRHGIQPKRHRHPKSQTNQGFYCVPPPTRNPKKRNKKTIYETKVERAPARPKSSTGPARSHARTPATEACTRQRQPTFLPVRTISPIACERFKAGGLWVARRKRKAKVLSACPTKLPQNQTAASLLSFYNKAKAPTSTYITSFRCSNKMGQATDPIVCANRFFVAVRLG